jgi:hypothetical protein
MGYEKFEGFDGREDDAVKELIIAAPSLELPETTKAAIYTLEGKKFNELPAMHQDHVRSIYREAAPQIRAMAQRPAAKVAEPTPADETVADDATEPSEKA